MKYFIFNFFNNLYLINKKKKKKKKIDKIVDYPYIIINLSISRCHIWIFFMIIYSLHNLKLV